MFCLWCTDSASRSLLLDTKPSISLPISVIFTENRLGKSYFSCPFYEEIKSCSRHDIQIESFTNSCFLERKPFLESCLSSIDLPALDASFLCCVPRVFLRKHQATEEWLATCYHRSLFYQAFAFPLIPSYFFTGD